MIQATIESGRAEFALNSVKKVVANEKDKTKKEYKSYVRSFPSLVLNNGLAAALAFVIDKKGDKDPEKKTDNNAYALLYNNISEWLKKKNFLADPIDLSAYVFSLKSDKYRVVTNEVLALFAWLKRFASGMIEGEGNDN